MAWPVSRPGQAGRLGGLAGELAEGVSVEQASSGV